MFVDAELIYNTKLMLKVVTVYSNSCRFYIMFALRANIRHYCKLPVAIG